MSLLLKDIDIIVAGAANILSTPHSFASLSDSNILSDTGNCKTFRNDADGYCRGDFVGAVVLQRLKNTVAYNDNFLAVVAASRRNHSGNSTSMTTSDAHAQKRLLRKILRNAQVSPDNIFFVEMHEKGTQIGDPAEMGAVGSTFKHTRRSNGPLPVGDIKADICHSEAVADMIELLKCIIMFHKNIIPPQAGMPHALNPRFPPLFELNIEISQSLRHSKKSLRSRDLFFFTTSTQQVIMHACYWKTLSLSVTSSASQTLDQDISLFLLPEREPPIMQIKVN